MLVAVRPPGEPLEQSTLVDAGSGLPYGTVPWWLTATIGMLVTPEGAREIPLGYQDARHNLLGTQSRISFSPDGLTGSVVWSESGGGQRGHEARRRLRSATPEERLDEMELMCGKSGDFEVLKAEAPALEDPASPFGLSCEGELLNVSVDMSQDEQAVGFAGPWIPRVPEFPSPVRVHPVVFPYPRTDISSFELAAPAGFAPRDPPPPVVLRTSFGAYSLRVAKTAEAFRVRRELVLPLLTVKAAEYPQLRQFLDDVRRADATMLEFGRLEPVP
ncbi:MAG TPA: hypothetical protein VFP98_05585 [Candidatus Polarisedimenticolia bacterium]|nr:hypothetical protein [Candidatus Polarisedimenticolia bacterium]